MFHEIARELLEADVRFVVIGVSGANYYAESSSALFSTRDTDLLLPSDAATVLAAWRVFEGRGMELWVGNEPLDKPRHDDLARRVVERRAAVTALDGTGLEIDLMLSMAGFEFDQVWSSRRVFIVGDVKIPVARLEQIVSSKALAGREKDRLFLTAHQEALEKMRKRQENS